MARTLADMTPEEQQECVGRWCDTPTITAVITSIRSTTKGSRVGIYRPEKALTVPFMTLELVAPRFDLTRAWNPDGTPPKGEWVEGHMWWGEDTDTMEAVDLVGAECLATGQIQGLDEWPDSVTPGEDVPVQRFITDWEERA